jgi:hypothetical protein
MKWLLWLAPRFWKQGERPEGGVGVQNGSKEGVSKFINQ